MEEVRDYFLSSSWSGSLSRQHRSEIGETDRKIRGKGLDVPNPNRSGEQGGLCDWVLGLMPEGLWERDSKVGVVKEAVVFGG
jgi:hypothetical protein